MSLFFFQAEDGIRDLVRSRGLGDVYKRQADDGPVDPDELQVPPDVQLDLVRRLLAIPPLDGVADHRHEFVAVAVDEEGGEAVSYTHLTLPTSDLVEISGVAVSLKKKKMETK